MIDLLLLVACNDKQQTVEIEGDSAIGLDTLVNSLEVAGATVEMAGIVSQPFFTPEGQVITINGQDVQVFEYENKADAKVEAELVSADGCPVGTSMMSWIATPHFYDRAFCRSCTKNNAKHVILHNL